MSNNKILLKISGSIAAYKIGVLISKLIQNGFEVQTVATKSALQFIGPATLEGLTGKPVYSDMFESGQMMDHINLAKWADITLLAPATANTINRLAAGMGDSLVTALFLAHDWTKPYLIAPAMNTKMLRHPATKCSFKTLRRWGVHVLSTASGSLACGDSGDGKMLEPEIIYKKLINQLHCPAVNSLSVLITYGGTQESIDGVRHLTNMSTGKTGIKLAQYFIQRGHAVTCLHASGIACPGGTKETISFANFSGLDKKINDIINSNTFDAIIHAAAVSDYSPVAMDINGQQFHLPLPEKLPSSNSAILKLEANPKLVDKFKSHPKAQKAVLVAFKLTYNDNKKDKNSAVHKLFDHSKADIVVLNDFSTRKNSEQKHFQLFSQKSSLGIVDTAEELAEKLEDILLAQLEKKTL
ncbi:MAG TPA: bifunctional phosphopantothenoylcysteine decarboxylase/phosphopantothenate--cysteine ligase CoaBC [Candidatus Marinimicrobia bacterium]|jgi:phosphopantothenoylcysteine decarboxylase/phosphopantothenate--cysteine ligase|nr:bifunctional phosphopantothenoylcysteine decarboxylase/phosphopantothenate--cysteine ligase CoaBC [Candidatus Neomarinimicrobiota bacterium]MEE1572799.1 bifunctional phosphopantothenoylcysteine decarboxylase/phosphopantothenate--cysteine ligase CoaBC [Candidatus Neomarinimicrobiota bacterium]HJL79067.1 bifunctional phosphopantothenoylcysteine decarboxylase/phosphopantothenate--cysteine ligase CoaBC [Candidatus Neomarinimicrobiota bacterium]HJN68405.1 bifunctional phosphopantothenoylcysteine d|tara:strand:- start:4667 stop:5902 length:1236 start_codon:yes stop_codon:yes gene_type:complete